MRRRYTASLLLASMLFAAIPQANPIADVSIVAEAHGGRTDSSGGHKDNKNASGLGSYHYHCGGYPAHLHTGGVCPYRSGSTTAETKAPAETKASTEVRSSAETQTRSSTETNTSATTGQTTETAAQEVPQTAAARQITPGWHKDDIGWKYYYADLTYAKGKWELISERFYCFDENGYLYISTYTPDGYWVDENGEWRE